MLLAVKRSPEHSGSPACLSAEGGRRARGVLLKSKFHNEALNGILQHAKSNLPKFILDRSGSFYEKEKEDPGIPNPLLVWFQLLSENLRSD
jgi:hypothetical protein